MQSSKDFFLSLLFSRLFSIWPLAWILLGCSQPSNIETALEEQILHFGLGSEPQSLDPHLATSVAAHNILSALLEGLVSEDPKSLKPSPGVAQSWSISQDGTTYTFKLRKNGRWSNGDPVTAHDFVYSFRRMLNPSLGAQYASMLYPLKNAKAFHQGIKTWQEAEVGVEALDDYTLRLTLENPLPYFLELLNHFSWFPVHQPTIEYFNAYEKIGTAWTKPKNFIGNGPFRLTNHHINSVIEVEKNEQYWDAKTVRLRGIRFYPIEAVYTEERAYRSGFLHLTQSVSADRIDFLQAEYPKELHFEPYLGTYFYRFNLQAPPFDDQRVREAFSLAIDRQRLVEKVLKGGQVPATSFTPPGTGGFMPLPKFRHDPEAAQALIRTYLQENGMDRLPPIELTYNTSEGHKKVAEALSGMWKDILGVEIRLLNMEWKVFLSTVAKGEFTLARAGWIGDYIDPHTFLHMWRTGEGLNMTGWGNQRYDEALRRAEISNSSEERWKNFQTCENLLAEEFPILPLYFYVHLTLRHPTVRGWYPTLLDHHPYKYVYLAKEGDP
ncbi:MAG: peptide ABC transporter substrate-binding protein [Opitutae bacterium]